MQYTGPGAHTNDVGAIQGNRPVPRQRRLYYFEVTILEAGERGRIGVGFSDKGFKMGKQPGWEPGSYGYHGDDGKKFHANGSGEAFGPQFGAGDVVGAGLHIQRQEIFFTCARMHHLGPLCSVTCLLGSHACMHLGGGGEVPGLRMHADKNFFACMVSGRSH